MSKRAIILLKVLVHLLCLAPFAWLLHFYTSGALALNADPVNYITHFTGDWAIYILLTGLAITPIRRLSPTLSWFIRFRRLIGLYAFFYATLHLSTYIFLFSGYDLPSVLSSIKAGQPSAILAEWKQIWPTVKDDILKRRFIQVGFFAWLILLSLACTSPAFIMRAMGGKNWQRLHRLIYVAAIAAVIHFWWLVKAGVRTPWKVTAVLTILLLARIAYTAIKYRKQPTKPPHSHPHRHHLQLRFPAVPSCHPYTPRNCHPGAKRRICFCLCSWCLPLPCSFVTFRSAPGICILPLLSTVSKDRHCLVVFFQPAQIEREPHPSQLFRDGWECKTLPVRP